METNIRRIITNLKDYRARDLYEKGYCAKSSSDRSSYAKFTANQFRLFYKRRC